MTTFIRAGVIAAKGNRSVIDKAFDRIARFIELALAVAGKWDAHANPLWDGGHIKLWSRRTLSLLLEETGFQNLQFRGAGRAPLLWMTMVMSGDKPRS